MAGEATFQINDVREYTVKEVELSLAMLLYNDKPTEIVTTLRPQRLTSTLAMSGTSSRSSHMMGPLGKDIAQALFVADALLQNRQGGLKSLTDRSPHRGGIRPCPELV